MHHHEHRTWFPYILIGLSVALALVVAVWFQPGEEAPTQNDQRAAQEVPDVMTEEEYRVTVNAILQEYQSGGDARAAYQALLDIVIPSTYKDVHLELVIIMGKFDAQKEEEAQARYDLLRQQNDWLAL